MISRALLIMKVSVPDNFTRQHATDCPTLQHTCPYPLLHLLLSSVNCLLLLSRCNCLMYMMCLSLTRRISCLGAVMSDINSLLAACSKGSGHHIAKFLVQLLCTAIYQLSIPCLQQRLGLTHCFALSCHSLHPLADFTVRLPLQDDLTPQTSAMTSAPRRSMPTVTPTLGSTATTGVRGWVCTW